MPYYRLLRLRSRSLPHHHLHRCRTTTLFSSGSSPYSPVSFCRGHSWPARLGRDGRRGERSPEAVVKRRRNKRRRRRRKRRSRKRKRGEGVELEVHPPSSSSLPRRRRCRCRRRRRRPLHSPPLSPSNPSPPSTRLSSNYTPSRPARSRGSEHPRVP